MENASELLKQLRLVDVVETGRILGSGAYGQVVEVHFQGLKCAGKKIHSMLLNQSPPDTRRAMVSRYVEECIM